jgi:hypothetical protein
MDSFSIIAGATATGRKEAASNAVKDVYDGPSAGTTSLGNNEFGFNDHGSENGVFHLKRVTVFLEIILDAGIPTRRAGFNCRLSDILKDLAGLIPLPELESPGLSLISSHFIHPEKNTSSKK